MNKRREGGQKICVVRTADCVVLKSFLETCDVILLKVTPGSPFSYLVFFARFHFVSDLMGVCEAQKEFISKYWGKVIIYVCSDWQF